MKVWRSFGVNGEKESGAIPLIWVVPPSHSVPVMGSEWLFFI